jgi:hypothetical protein
MSFDSRLAEPRARAAALFKALLPGRRTRRPPARPEQHERRAEAQPGRREGAGARPENFFDTDFLRKLERLHLVAKRLSWAGAAGEHPASRKGFSLEFSDYRRYQAGDDLRYVDWNLVAQAPSRTGASTSRAAAFGNDGMTNLSGSWWSDEGICLAHASRSGPLFRAVRHPRSATRRLFTGWR